MPMLTIRHAQMSALRRTRLVAFFERAQAFIADRLHTPVTLTAIETMYERGKLYALHSEQDFVRYMFVRVAVGAPIEAADPDWMRAILEVPTPSNALKLHRLFDEAQKHVAPSVAGLHQP